MRYDKAVYFRKEIPGEYDPTTGNYAEATVDEEEELASVFSTGISMMELVYGKLQEGSLTIHIQNHHAEPFNNIRIGEKIYDVDRILPLRNKDVFIVHEVM